MNYWNILYIILRWKKNSLIILKYSEKDSHLKEHAAFSNYIKGFLDVKNRDNILEAKNLLKYLNNWIVYHIKEVDMKYVPFVKEKIENN